MRRPLALLVLPLVFVQCVTGQPVTRRAPAARADGEAASAEQLPTPGVGYVGMTLPPDLKLFPNSPWTTPIPPRPAIDPDSKAQIDLLRTALEERLKRKPDLQINATRFTAPIHVIDPAKAPRVDVPCDAALPRSLDPSQTRVAQNIPIPDGVWADPGGDRHVIIVDPVAKVAYEFWNFRKIGNREYHAGMAGKWDLSGQGENSPATDPYFRRNGANAAKLPYIAGLLRYDEMERGRIDHALAMVVPTTRAGDFRAPAVSTDGKRSGREFIPEGSRIQLNPDLNLDSLGLSPTTRIIARCLQVYGAYIIDTAAGWNIKAQNLGPDGGAWRKYAKDLNLDAIPIEEFRVLK